jgi:hypothetical protein
MKYLLAILLLVPTISLADTLRINPSADVSQGPAWTLSTSSPWWSKINQPTVTSPTTPSTSTPIQGDDLGTYNVGNPDAQIFFDMSNVTGVQTVSSITVYLYAKGTLTMDGTVANLSIAYTTTGSYVANDQYVPSADNLTDTYTWYSKTFSGLSLTQTNLNNLQLILTVSEDVLGEHGSVQVAEMYAIVTYTPPPPHKASILQ